MTTKKRIIHNIYKSWDTLFSYEEVKSTFLLIVKVFITIQAEAEIIKYLLLSFEFYYCYKIKLQPYLE